mgnify:CR=1 FL=1
MSLELQGVSQVVDGQLHIAPTNLVLEKGTMNVLLGPTSSGKTSLMRLMAGLDKPSTGRILSSGKDVTNQRVQLRNVAMVYQEFINYPGMTVFDNIASPLRLKGQSKADIDRTVRTTAEMLKLTSILQRRPLELSGGQQQRCALARALVKGAELVLLDEPLAGIDPIAINDVKKLINKLKSKNIGVLITDHNVRETLEIVDRAYILFDGSVIMSGVPNQVKSDKRVRDVYLGNDF